MKGAGRNESLSPSKKVNIEQSMTLMLVVCNWEKLTSDKTNSDRSFRDMSVYDTNSASSLTSHRSSMVCVKWLCRFFKFLFLFIYSLFCNNIPDLSNICFALSLRSLVLQTAF